MCRLYLVLLVLLVVVSVAVSGWEFELDTPIMDIEMEGGYGGHHHHHHGHHGHHGYDYDY
jgi:hypothetical protein